MAEVTAQLSLDIARLQAGLKKANEEIAGFKASMRRQGHEGGSDVGSGFREGFKTVLEGSGLKEAFLGAIGGGTAVGGIEAFAGLLEGLQSIAEEYAHLYDLAKRFDTSTDGIQRLSIIAQRSGTDVNSLVGDMQKLQRALENVGDAKVQAALDELKLSAVDLAGESPERQLEMIADAFKDAQREGRGFGAVFELMGRGAGEMLPLLRDYAEHAKAASEVEIVAPDQMEAIKKTTDLFAQLVTQVKAWVVMPHDAGPLNFAIPGNLIKLISIYEKLRQYQAAGQQNAINQSDTVDKETVHTQPADDADHVTETTWRQERMSPDDVAKASEEAARLAAKKAEQEKIQQEQARQTADLQRTLAEEKAKADDASLDAAEKMANAKDRLAGLEAQIAAIQGTGIEKEKERLKLAIEAERTKAEIARNQATIDQKNKAENEERDTLRDTTRKSTNSLLSHEGHARALRDQIGQSLGVKITGVNDLKAGLKSMQEAIAAAKKRGDTGTENSLRKRYNTALEETKELGRYSGERTSVGETAGALSVIMGGSGHNLAAETTNSLLQKIDTTLQTIAKSVDPTDDSAFTGGM